MIGSTMLEPTQITPAMQSFARSLRVERMGETESESESRGPVDIDQLYVAFKPGDINVLSYTLSAKHQYAVQNSPYIFEMTQDRMSSRQKGGQGFYRNPRAMWRACMFGRTWDKLLERQSYLRIGEASDWEPSELTTQTFFPDRVREGDGLKFFMEKARAIARLLETQPDSVTAALSGLDLRGRESEMQRARALPQPPPPRDLIDFSEATTVWDESDRENEPTTAPW